MKIKKIIEYDWNYGEYIISDGNYDLICMCISVPLPNNLVPQIGMTISKIYAFSFGDFKIVKLLKQGNKEFFIKKEKEYFSYCLQGKIIDKKRALVQVYDFIISLEYQFSNGFSADYSEGDFINFKADRLDCCVDLDSIS